MSAPRFLAFQVLAQIRTEHSEGTDFSKYKTFMWIKEPNATNPLSNQRIVDDVNSALTSKGLRLVTSDADLGIAAHVATETQQTLQIFYDGFGGGWRWRDTLGSATTTVNTYTVGTLIIGIFDAGTKMAIWRGTAIKTLSDSPQSGQTPSTSDCPDVQELSSDEWTPIRVMFLGLADIHPHVAQRTMLGWCHALSVECVSPSDAGLTESPVCGGLPHAGRRHIRALVWGFS